MKNRYFHLIYLTIIGFLVYQVWAKSQALNEAISSIEQFEKLSRANDIYASFAFDQEMRTCDKIFQVYKTDFLLSLKEKIDSAYLSINAINQWLDKQRDEFINLAGGYDKNQKDVLAKRFDTNVSRLFFNQNKVREFRDSLNHFQTIIENEKDSNRLKDLKSRYYLLKILDDEHYWQQWPKLTAAESLARITALENRLKLDKMSFIFSYLYSFTDKDIRFDSFKVEIYPKKAVLFEGETFKADVFVAAFSSNPGPDVSFLINNEVVPYKDGIAHFEKREMTVGKKIVKAIAKIKNPLTGQVTTTEGEFEYEVLPKCSRNCQ